MDSEKKKKKNSRWTQLGRPPLLLLPPFSNLAKLKLFSLSTKKLLQQRWSVNINKIGQWSNFNLASFHFRWSCNHLHFIDPSFPWNKPSLSTHILSNPFAEMVKTFQPDSFLLNVQSVGNIFANPESESSTAWTALKKTFCVILLLHLTLGKSLSFGFYFQVFCGVSFIQKCCFFVCICVKEPGMFFSLTFWKRCHLSAFFAWD